MLKNRIITCLDVKDDRVVKGVNFVDLPEQARLPHRRIDPPMALLGSA